MADGCIGPINIIPDNNEVVLQDVNQVITVIDNNCCTTVDVTQPTTAVVQILTGPMGKFPTEGPYGFTGSFGISGSLTVTGSISSNYIQSPYFTGSFYGNGTGIFSGSFSGSISSNLQEVTDNGATTTNVISASGLDTNALNVLGNVNVTGSLTVSGSNTFRNIGPAQFTGSTDITGSLSINGVDYEFTSASFDTRVLNNSASISYLSSSYLLDSASFDVRILNNSASISLLSSSYLTDSGSFSTRVTDLENFSSSLDATFATDAELNYSSSILSSSIAYLSGSYLNSSASFNTRILNNSTSISLLSSSFLNFSSSLDSTFATDAELNSATASLSSSIAYLSGSYLNSSASFDTRILNNSSSISLLSSSFLNTSSSLNTRVTDLESFSSSLDSTFATDAELNAATASLSGSISYLSSSYLDSSASFNTRILDNSSSIALLSGSFINFSSSYSTGSFTGSFTGSLEGTASNAVTASYILNAISSSYSQTASFAQTASYVLNAVSSSFASTASYVQNAQTASYVLNAVSSSFSSTASYLNTLNQNLTFNGNLTLNGTASITYLNVAYESASVIYSSGSNQLGDATDDTQTLIGRTIVSGSFEVTGSTNIPSITGSLLGTASYAINTLSSSYALTASYATTSSYLTLLKQQIILSGSLKLDPTQDPDPTGLDLDSTVLFQSSSNTALGYDLYVRQNGNLVKWKWIEGILETGLLYGGVVTYSGSNVFVSPGSGIIADHNATTGSEVSPMIEYVTWNAITQSITNIASQQVTYLYIDNNGTLQQQPTLFTAQQYHDYIPLGAAGHFDYTQISAFGGAVQTAYDQVSQMSNFVDAFGPLKVSGYGITGQPGSLRLSVGSGISFIHGGFYANDPEFPSQITTPSVPTASFAYLYRSGSGVQFDTNGGNFYTTLRPKFYDPGTGITGSVSNNDWTIQRLYSDPKTGIIYAYYGQNIYPDYLTAVGGLSTDSFTEGDTFAFTTFIGFLILKSNTSDITDITDNRIVPAGLFRGSGQGSGGGIALSNLEDLTDVSITSPINGQALIYDAGIWQNGVPTNSTSASYALTASYLSGYVSPFPYTGSAIITGSLVVTGSITSTEGFTGSLYGTSSWASNAISASYALTASYALNGGGGGSTDTGSLLTTASVALNTITFTKGDGSTFPITVDTGSGGGGSGAGFPFTGSAQITGSLVVTGSVTATSFSGDGTNITGITSTNVSSQLFNFYNFI